MADRLVHAAVALHRLDGPRPAERGGDPQDPGAGAEVEDASPRASIGGRSAGQRRQAQLGGGMEPGSESRAGIDHERCRGVRCRGGCRGLPGGKDSAEAGDIDRPVAGAELGLPVVGLLVTDAADVAAVERPEACCGGAGARFVSKPECGGDRVAGRHPVTVGIARSGVEHHCA